ncbi:MAG: hypothetical protein ACRDUX_36635 [Mycobacterium sp.]
MTDPRLHIRPPEWLKDAVTPDGVAIMREAGVIPDTTPDALAAVAGICPVFRIEQPSDGRTA